MHSFFCVSLPHFSIHQNDFSFLLESSCRQHHLLMSNYLICLILLLLNWRHSANIENSLLTALVIISYLANKFSIQFSSIYFLECLRFRFSLRLLQPNPREHVTNLEFSLIYTFSSSFPFQYIIFWLLRHVLPHSIDFQWRFDSKQFSYIDEIHHVKLIKKHESCEVSRIYRPIRSFLKTSISLLVT